MESEQKKEKETLSDITIDISKDIWPILASAITSLAVLYFALRPETFIITAMGIFHLHPEVLLTIFYLAIPFIVAATLARVSLLIWRFILAWPAAIISAFFIYPLLLLDKHIIKKGWSDRTHAYLKKAKSKRKPEKSPKFLRSNVIMFVLFSVLFFSCYFWSNPISNRWLPYRNTNLVLIAYSHYNCQITGNYNESECEYWKNELLEYRKNNSISTPIDSPQWLRKFKD